MKTLLTYVSLLILAVGSAAPSPVLAQVLEPGRTLLASHQGTDSYAALSSAAGFPSAGADYGIPQIGPGFSPQPQSPIAPGYAPFNPGQWDSPARGENQYDSARTGPGAVSLPATGIGTAPVLPRTMAGDTANNSVLYKPIPSGQYSYGFGRSHGGGGGGQRSPGSGYAGRLPATSTSSIDFDIVDR